MLDFDITSIDFNLNTYLWTIANTRIKFMMHSESFKQTVVSSKKPFHTHPFYEMLIAVGDSCIIHFSDKDILLKKNSFAIIHPSVTHCASVENPHELLTIDFLYYNDAKKSSKCDLFSELEASLAKNAYMVVPPSESTSSIFESLYKLGHYKKPFSTELIFSHFITLIFEMLSNLTSPNFEKELIRSPFTEPQKSASIRMSNDIIQKIDNILSTAYMTNITAKSLSNDLHICEKQINRYILSQYSQTFLQRKTMIRINVACEMLTNTNLSIAEISTRVGYTSINTFYSAFKNQIGITPNEFRIHSQNDVHKCD